jgi:hypothetical protein
MSGGIAAKSLVGDFSESQRLSAHQAAEPQKTIASENKADAGYSVGLPKNSPRLLSIYENNDFKKRRLRHPSQPVNVFKLSFSTCAILMV